MTAISKDKAKMIKSQTASNNSSSLSHSSKASKTLVVVRRGSRWSTSVGSGGEAYQR